MDVKKLPPKWQKKGACNHLMSALDLSGAPAAAPRNQEPTYAQTDFLVQSPERIVPTLHALLAGRKESIFH